ncbi:MAG: (2Fe-2S)-binding protein [Bacteroidetes bacterium]|nr:(2Fe-2S)-binding protein [Rhodothermia bacterium]MCS7155909.1 (2Fe-2S)-binding protein [Bacteroidota bacterium]MCX7905915.1 (2Fe-2S)-binding protein [Bacteroidota bacterium]MDW8138118.1 (2Fe-2S)-binding protein [Bacteroidota bacterium]MDW8285802.1 (2Fe-2S)-binding protein [Bacteroidota bacterium]
MPEPILIWINDRPMTVEAGLTVAAALARAGYWAFRRSVSGKPRGPLCGIGLCFECRVRINGRPAERACWVPCTPGMRVECPDAL